MRLTVRALLASVAIALLAPAAASASFSFGVTSGEVTPDSAKLWAHPNQTGLVVLKVATDRNLQRVVALKLDIATRLSDLTVQRTVDHLRSNTRYWYRFVRLGTSDASALGTFVTPPSRNDNAPIRFAWTGDTDATPGVGQTQPYWNNFDIFRRMQEENNQFNIHLGDTIYSDSEVPGRLNPVALTVQQKWAKYRLNLGQAKLASLRGSAGFYSHWDDHEFINDFARSENVFSSGSINGQLLYLRGLKAFTDYSPVDYSFHDGLYRTRRWGKNLELFFLDERSFRSAKASANGVCNNPQTGAPDLAPTAPQSVRNVFAALVPSLAAPVSPACLAKINDPNRTMLGKTQLAEFLSDLRNSDARFKVIINEMPIQQYYTSTAASST